jgi:hypothetical protein
LKPYLPISRIMIRLSLVRPVNRKRSRLPIHRLAQVGLAGPSVDGSSVQPGIAQQRRYLGQ